MPIQFRKGVKTIIVESFTCYLKGGSRILLRHLCLYIFLWDLLSMGYTSTGHLKFEVLIVLL
jgi:hypothetical protein